MKIRKIYEDDNGATVEFIPVRNVPSFTHRVIVNGKAADWLSDTHRPSKTTARFFLDKHAPTKENT